MGLNRDRQRLPSTCWQQDGRLNIMNWHGNHRSS